ncbi:MAG: hypothetical protein COB46_03995 [Rhodospirillaceae bacterium]|nr:MAG: hypothetical protein COB46_03995 [Rhodospirillaceae bacterium]
MCVGGKPLSHRFQNIQSRLQSRNVTIRGHRTSLRLEGDVWSALEEICIRENKSVHAVCELIEERRVRSSRTAAVRAYILTYFRAAASESGHVQAGHGSMKPVKSQTPVSDPACANTEIRVNL